jgi:hypothetical protein
MRWWRKKDIFFIEKEKKQDGCPSGTCVYCKEPVFLCCWGFGCRGYGGGGGKNLVIKELLLCLSNL